MPPLQTICLLGATGSIGDSTLEVVRQHRDRFQVVSAAAGKNWEKMIPLVKEFGLERVCLWDAEAAAALRKKVSVEVLEGMDGLLALAGGSESQTVVNGLVGAVGCRPTLEAISKGKRVGLANKETMVMAGDIINRRLRQHANAALIPIDSEHSAVFQCLAGRPPSEVDSIILTASGGPFRTWDREKFQDIDRKAALNHPTWDMGPKITIDSATMMNKGLEVIEARYLFDVPLSRVKIIVHPTSTVHSFVQFQDGSLMAQLGSPDMKLPIQYALTYPERWPLQMERLDLAALGKLEFYPADPEKFPCIRLAYQAGEMGGTAPAILNAANEIAVDAFLNPSQEGRPALTPGLAFTQIPEVIEEVLESVSITQKPELEDVLEADWSAREAARKQCHKRMGTHA